MSLFGWLFGQGDEYGRSGQWPRVRREHLEREPACIACGRRENLEVHHIQPLSMGGAELDPDNLCTLCGDPCHLVHGHLMSFHRANPYVREDAARYLRRLREHQ